MSQPEWARIEIVLDSALDLDPAERPAYLDHACGRDEALRAEVERLLAADDAAGHIRSLHLDVDPAPPDLPQAGETIGPWRIERSLGFGGMGMVFRVHRDDGQFQRVAALKMIRGPVSDNLLRRFHAERESLARLDHPGIARILDGGITDNHQPWLVMEYVEGLPIDQWCTRHSAALTTRLDLFDRVCRTVAHAHARLVVHRDIKPANILVDAGGQPRLVDFGIAKIMDAAGRGQTATGAALLTPGYAAPEQITGGEITVATDVYGLGALLYHLLAGRPPFVADDTGLPEMIRRITREMPPAPGCLRRDDDPRNRPVDRELDLLCLTALRKAPGERYAGVEALREDLARYRSGHPLAAVPPSAGYRLRKFMARHRGATAATAGIVLLVTATMSAVIWQAGIARAERDESRRQAEIAGQTLAFMEEIFTVEARQDVEPDEITALDLLDQGLERIRADLATQPEIRAPLMHALGDAYGRLGRYERAIELHREALSTIETLDHFPPADRLDYMQSLAFQHMARGDYAHAETVIERTLAFMRDRDGLPLRLKGQVHQTRALIADFQDDTRTSLDHFRRAIDLYAESDQISLRADALLGLGNVLFDAGRAHDALAATREGVALMETLDKPRSAALLRARNDLALRAYGVGDLETALNSFRALTAPVDTQPDAELTTGDMLWMANHAGVAVELGHLDEAARRIRRAQALREATYSPTSAYLAAGYLIQGLIDLEQGDPESARRVLARARPVLAPATTPTRGRAAGVQVLQQHAVLHADGPDGVAERINTLMPVIRAQPGILNRHLVWALQGLVEARLAAGRGDILTPARELVSIADAGLPETAWRRPWAHCLEIVARVHAGELPAGRARVELDRLYASLPDGTWRIDWLEAKLRNGSES